MVGNKKERKARPVDTNRTRNIIILVVVIALISVAGVQAAKNGGNNTKNKLKPHQETEEIKTGDLQITVKATGNLEPWEKIDLRPEASGKVEKLLVDLGDMVEQGQVVAILDQTSQNNTLERAKANVSLAKANLDEVKKGYRARDKASLEDQISQAKLKMQDAEREFKRVKDLYDQGFASQKEYDSAKTYYDQVKAELAGLEQQLKILLKGGEKESVQSAQAQYNIALADLKEAERMLGDASVKAPMAGVILHKFVTEGSVILSGLSTFSQGEAIFTIGDVSRMKLIAQVDEGDIGKVKLGQTALIKVDAYPDEKFEGKVTMIAPQGASGETVMTTFGVRVEIDNAERKLKSGFTADVEIVVEEIKGAVLVPFRAVLEKNDKFYVFVVGDGDIIEEREIKVGKTNYESYEVLSGLKAGEKVITKGRPNKLKSEKEEKKSSGAIKISTD